MATKFLRTSDLARAVGIHPNTVRLYVDWGLLPPVQRSRIIDLGPEGGVAGGQLLAEGTPEDVAQVKESYTGQFLKEML